MITRKQLVGELSDALKAVNYAVIMLAAIVIALFGAIYFLGNKESYNEIKNTLVLAFFIRLFFCSFFSFSFSILLLLVNLIIQWVTRRDQTFPFKIALHSIIITMTGSVLGLAIFFIL